MYIYVYMYVYNSPVKALVRPPYLWSGDSQGQETFLAPSVDNQIHNFDTEYSNHHPSLTTVRSKGLSSGELFCGRSQQSLFPILYFHLRWKTLSVPSIYRIRLNIKIMFYRLFSNKMIALLCKYV